MEENAPQFILTNRGTSLAMKHHKKQAMGINLPMACEVAG